MTVKELLEKRLGLITQARSLHDLAEKENRSLSAEEQKKFSDILERGIMMAGGGSLIAGIDKLMSEETRMPVYITEDPMTAVVRGCGKVLDDPSLLQRVKVVGGLR